MVTRATVPRTPVALTAGLNSHGVRGCPNDIIDQVSAIDAIDQITPATSPSTPNSITAILASTRRGAPKVLGIAAS